MTYDILLKTRPSGGYIARALNLPDCEAVGATREEALSLARNAIAKELAQAEIVRINLPDSQNPLAAFAGVFKDDPQFDMVMAEIAAYRRQLDAGNLPDAIPA